MTAAPLRSRLLAFVRIGWSLIWLVQLGAWAGQIWMLDALPRAALVPLWPFHWLPPAGGAYAEILLALGLVGTAMLLLGLKTRWVGPLTFSSGVLLGSLVMGYGKISHSSQWPLLVLLVFQFSPWGRAWSLDAKRAPGRWEPSGTGEWPYVSALAAAGLMYLSSAVLKVARGEFLGDGRLYGFVQARALDAAAFHYPSTGWRDGLVAWVLAHPGVVAPLAILSVLAEGTLLLALFSRRMRGMGFASILALHGGIGLIAWLSFPLQQLTAFLLLVPSLVLALREGPAWKDRIPASTRTGPWSAWLAQGGLLAGSGLALLAIEPFLRSAAPVDVSALASATAPVVDFLSGPWVSLLGLLVGVTALAWLGLWLLRDAWRAVQPPHASGMPSLLLYDRDCGFCQQWVAWARGRGVVETDFVPCQDAAALRLEAGIGEAACLQSSFLVTTEKGRPIEVLEGAGAINGVMARTTGWRNAGWRVLALAYRLGGIRQAQQTGYAWIASHRHLMPGASEACDVPSQPIKPLP